MRIVNIVLSIFGAIFVVLLVFLMVGYALFSFAPGIKSEMNISQGSSAALASYDTKVTAFKKQVQDASTANQKKDITLSLTEEEINSKISEMIAEDKLPFHELYINLNNNVCWVYFTASTPLSNAKVGLTMNTTIVKNDIDVSVLKFQLGRLPLPKSYDAYAEDLANVFLKTQSPFTELQADLKSINISSKQLILQVTTIPAG
jgi:uncharacterized protein YpmS